MEIKEFISNFRNHPVLFIGTGMSLRYLKNSYDWNDLLKKVCRDFKGNDEYYLDIKSECEHKDSEGEYNFPKIATIIEEDFNNYLKNNRSGKFEEINDIFYEEMEDGNNISRFKIYLSKILSEVELKEEKKEEIDKLRQIRKNIASIVTTNYDSFIEEIFNFNPLIGNDILLSNPYGAVYKIHGCVSTPSRIIISEEDYDYFREKYELIRAQLLSIFIHNPIIFLGYEISDANIKRLLKTIFTYVEPNSDQAKKIRENFLLVEYDEGSTSTNIVEHDVDIEGLTTIRIYKIKTDNFSAIYDSLADLTLPVSAMDVRKVQTVVKEINTGGEIEVNISDDLENLDNRDKILAIGSKKTIEYRHQSPSEIITNYFSIVEESKEKLLELVNDQTIQVNRYFPIFAFSNIADIEESERLKEQQIEKVEAALDRVHDSCESDNQSIDQIMDDESISDSNKYDAILWSIINERVDLGEAELFLRDFEDKNATPFRKLICAYDLKKYGEEE
ncbi:SIR2 family protein [Aliifodinibius salipaludis]|uniref:SIR2 family protein n=1 Tax=Fodinibius salipaludis TaxID=2032627 RepID=A0A2A2GA14_9BACT|nr:SIR2 family protein [Aliifodinibius salipaludis]PAU93844.1 SIR2 family protein [Aliifodinibius salipaludis]